MAEPKGSLSAALKQVQPSWDEPRSERALSGMHRKRAERKTRAIGGAATLGLLVVVGGLASWRSGDQAQHQGTAQLAGSAGARTVHFADGSQALLLDAAAQVVVEHASKSAINVGLPSGHARFDVAQRPTRTFQVICDQVVVRVIGTGFELTRAGERTFVRVLHGRVSVSWPAGETELGAGESGWFPARTPAADDATSKGNEALDAPELPAELEVIEASEPDPSQRPRPRVASAASWRQHAEQGDFQQAFAILERERARISDDVDELLLAADAARLSGHAAQAVPYLQRVVERHAQDPRAPLAAFTLGGVLMNQLGRPREAEAAYGRARAMSPGSALSQDALARQVEALHRASDSAAARALALEYLERYPDGRRVQAMRRFGGLR